MNRESVGWRGNFTAVVTPFTADGTVDAAAFGRNIELLIEEGIDGVVVAGHTGESWALADEERYQLFALAREVAGGRVTVIGGASAIRTGDAIRHARAAAERNLDGVLLTAPAYAMVKEHEVYAHVATVAAGGGLPIMVYNIPRRVGIALTPAFLERLAEIDGVVAVKQSGPSFDELAALVDRAGDRLLVFAGASAERGLAAVAVGVDGFVSSLETQVLGAEAIALWRLAVAGDGERARSVQRRCAELSRLLHGIGTDPAALKVAMNHLGRPGGYPRPPVLPLTEEEAGRVRAFVDDLVAVPA